LLTGLSIWVRPDGLTLAGPVLLAAATQDATGRDRGQSVLRFMLGLMVPVGLYLLFNWRLGGTPMPSTFYAKQAEYAGWQAASWSGRLWQTFLQVFTGSGVLLLPGAISWAWSALRRRNWALLASAGWTAGYMLLYVSRLPVYQHGRYLMPAMPVLFLFGLLGLADFGFRPATRVRRVVALAWKSSTAALWLVFVLLGARSYAADVALIESEMVRTAMWSASHLPRGALIAAHDIGALGYLDDHPIVDLAGLITPEVIPFLRDQDRLAAYLDTAGAEYLIAFPEFYPQLIRGREAVFVSGGSFAQRAGFGNMTVYRWDRRE
jgi:hypothetical protein